jgi:hypothetical protein
MQAIDLLRWALESTEQGFLALVEDLRATPMTPSTPGGKRGDGNHAVWTLGHLCVIEGGLRTILLDQPNPVEHWKPLFAAGTTPSNDPANYPAFDELLRTFQELRSHTLRLLDGLDAEALDRTPPNIPPGFEQAMQTVGQTCLLLALHQMVHYGELADVRRVVGLQPLL